MRNQDRVPIREQVRQALKAQAWRDPRLKAVASLAHEAVANSRWVSLEEAARVAHYCPGHFSAFFREHAGIPFAIWQLALRMKRAEDLLVQKEWMPLSAVGRTVGYGSPASFSHAFKRYAGITARQLRWLIRANPPAGGDLSAVERLDHAYELAMRGRRWAGGDAPALTSW
jgi:transcriptional regulator GlxA family with amidase domain